MRIRAIALSQVISAVDPEYIQERNTIAATDFDASPWQHYLEGPPHLANISVINNTWTACGGYYGQRYGVDGYTVNCSGLNNGTNLPTYPAQPAGVPTAGFCIGSGGVGDQLPSTCDDMKSMRVIGNRAPDDCTVFDDKGAQSTCCSACGPLCRGCC